MDMLQPTGILNRYAAINMNLALISSNQWSSCKDILHPKGILHGYIATRKAVMYTAG